MPFFTVERAIFPKSRRLWCHSITKQKFYFSCGRMRQLKRIPDRSSSTAGSFLYCQSVQLLVCWKCRHHKHCTRATFPRMSFDCNGLTGYQLKAQGTWAAISRWNLAVIWESAKRCRRSRYFHPQIKRDEKKWQVMMASQRAFYHWKVCGRKIAIPG